MVSYFGCPRQGGITPLEFELPPLQPLSDSLSFYQLTFWPGRNNPLIVLPHEKPFLCLPNSLGSCLLPPSGGFSCEVVPVWGIPPASTPGLLVSHPLPF